VGIFCKTIRKTAKREGLLWLERSTPAGQLPTARRFWLISRIITRFDATNRNDFGEESRGGSRERSYQLRESNDGLCATTLAE
jgi:hypothetical protein